MYLNAIFKKCMYKYFFFNIRIYYNKLTKLFLDDLVGGSNNMLFAIILSVILPSKQDSSLSGNSNVSCLKPNK